MRASEFIAPPWVGLWRAADSEARQTAEMLMCMHPLLHKPGGDAVVDEITRSFGGEEWFPDLKRVEDAEAGEAYFMKESKAALLP